MNHRDLEQEGASCLKHCHQQPHISSTARTLRDKRDEQRFEVRGPRFEVFGTSNPELRTSFSRTPTNYLKRKVPFGKVW
jgi:hypothetical protein